MKIPENAGVGALKIPENVRLTISEPDGLMIATGEFPTRWAFTYLLAVRERMDYEASLDLMDSCPPGSNCGIGNAAWGVAT